MTPRETILTALADLLRTVPHVPLLRGEVLPERIPPSGLMILRDGNPGEPGVTLSPLMYHYQHRAELEVIVQTGEDRDARFDRLIGRIGAAIAADRTLRGRCDWVEAEAPEPVDLPIEGGAEPPRVSERLNLSEDVPDGIAEEAPPRHTRPSSASAAFVCIASTGPITPATTPPTVQSPRSLAAPTTLCGPGACRRHAMPASALV